MTAVKEPERHSQRGSERGSGSSGSGSGSESERGSGNEAGLNGVSPVASSPPAHDDGALVGRPQPHHSVCAGGASGPAAVHSSGTARGCTSSIIWSAASARASGPFPPSFRMITRAMTERAALRTCDAECSSAGAASLMQRRKSESWKRPAGGGREHAQGRRAGQAGTV